MSALDDVKQRLADALDEYWHEGFEAGVEAAARAMCPGCRDGIPYSTIRLHGNLHHHEPFTGALMQCNALGIRALVVGAPASAESDEAASE